MWLDPGSGRSPGEGNGKPLQYSCLKKPMNSVKRQKDGTVKDELPRSVGTQYATGYQWRNNSNIYVIWGFSSVQFSHSVVSDCLWPHESQHARPPCPSPTPGVHPDSHPSSQWCHPAISSSVVPLSSCPQSLPASESFPMSQLFAWGVQSTGVSDIN